MKKQPEGIEAKTLAHKSEIIDKWEILLVELNPYLHTGIDIPVIRNEIKKVVDYLNLCAQQAHFNRI